MLSLPENIEMAPSSPELPVSTAPRCDTALSAKAAAIQADVDICWVHSSVESEEDIRSEEESDTGESKLRLVDFLRLDTTEPPVATLGSRPNSRRNSVQLTTQLSLPPTNDFAGLSKVLLLDDQFENCSELRRAPFGLLLEATNKVDQKRYLLDVVCLGDLSETVANALLESSMRLAALSNAFVSRYFNSWITVCSTNDRLLEVTAGYPNKRSVSGRGSEGSVMQLCLRATPSGLPMSLTAWFKYLSRWR
ncbi:MAG: uncharacterized protein KVP18_000149 [Porospora cf. gigantea A]|uniref:uncharacterized protein n=1 Tax=Porospora cf. gigantea A TaxID=2853593 RepID=UPI00355A6B36|nr:MAG: hypothetical protein KVP18_000149 [Porospora cf. gigantea A]